jgi:hypothetical protein
MVSRIQAVVVVPAVIVVPAVPVLLLLPVEPAPVVVVVAE